MTDVAATDPSVPALARLTAPAGPTVVGKGTIVTELHRRRPDLFILVSATTHRPHPGEVDGVHYHLVSDEDFDSPVASDQMLEWALVHKTYRYDTPRDPVQDRLNAGCPTLLEIGLDGARQVCRAVPETRLVSLTPLSWEELVRRLVGRGTESAQEQERRLTTARAELNATGGFNHVVINGTMTNATVELEKLMGLGSQNNVALNYRDWARGMHILGTSPQPGGITNPPIDDLLEKVGSKYGLVVEAAKHARQTNTYTQQLRDNQFEFFGPLVDSEVGKKSLGIALRETAEDKLEIVPGNVARARRAEAGEARQATEAGVFSDISLDSPVSLESDETPTNLDDIQF